MPGARPPFARKPGTDKPRPAPGARAPDFPPRRRPAAPYAPHLPPQLQAIVDEHAQRLVAALTDALGARAADLEISAPRCTDRCAGVAVWRLSFGVHLALPDEPSPRPPAKEPAAHETR